MTAIVHFLSRKSVSMNRYNIEDENDFCVDFYQMSTTPTKTFFLWNVRDSNFSVDLQITEENLFFYISFVNFFMLCSCQLQQKKLYHYWMK